MGVGDQAGTLSWSSYQHDFKWLTKKHIMVAQSILLFIFCGNSWKLCCSYLLRQLTCKVLWTKFFLPGVFFFFFSFSISQRILMHILANGVLSNMCFALFPGHDTHCCGLNLQARGILFHCVSAVPLDALQVREAGICALLTSSTTSPFLDYSICTELTCYFSQLWKKLCICQYVFKSVFCFVLGVYGGI